MRYWSCSPDFHLHCVHLASVRLRTTVLKGHSSLYIVSFKLHSETLPISSLHWLSAGSCWIEMYFTGLVNCQADRMGLMVLDMRCHVVRKKKSIRDSGQRGGSLTMLIKHQDGGSQPRAQPTRDWEDCNTCTHGWPEHSTSLEHVFQHSGEREGERKEKSP